MHPHQPLTTAQLNTATTLPIRTELNSTDYEWAGATLQRLLGTPKRIAELWPFFSGEHRSARLAATPVAGGVTLRELVTAMPQLLGPSGIDPEHRQQKYFFVKFLDPSDFPAFAYVGFHPERIQRVRDQLERLRARRFDTPEEWRQAFRTFFADLLWQDRHTLESLRRLLAPHIHSPETFAQLKLLYQRWAITQAQVGWNDDAALDVRAWLHAAQCAEAQALLHRQREIRRQLAVLMHRIDFHDDQAVLIKSPTLHAIAGLSLQLHPNAPTQRFPKDEAWIYKSVYDAEGTRLGWILVEPQRTFDTTESGADFFTPFAWTGTGLGFRKTITRPQLDRFVSLMDVEARPAARYQRTAHAVTLPDTVMEGAVQWYRTIEEDSWPYFIVRELRFAAAGSATTPLTHESFTELHVTQGVIEATLRRGTTQHQWTLSPLAPALLPATLPYDTIQYRAAAAAQLLLVTRR